MKDALGIISVSCKMCACANTDGLELAHKFFKNITSMLI